MRWVFAVAMVALVTAASIALLAGSPWELNNVGLRAGGKLAKPLPVTSSTVPPCTPDVSLSQPRRSPPSGLQAALDAFLSGLRVSGHSVGVSVWIDGYGEVMAHDPDRMLVPASNQKILVAIGALAILGADVRLTTELLLTPAGDLVVVGGGDPTLRSTGPHSLMALATHVQASGVEEIGRVLVDESRHDGARRANGWQDWQIPTYTGPLSAFMVDDNRWRGDNAFLADPALGNAERLEAALRAAGIAVHGGVAYGAAPEGSMVVASARSAPVSELVAAMLQRSDNQIADILMKEVGRAGAGIPSLVVGGEVSRSVLRKLCIESVGRDDDGSGLSRSNGRSAREWRTLLQAARVAPWWSLLFEALPIAGRTGTLSSRFGGTAAEANVRAKTGTVIGGAALSGYGTTRGGRAFVFSVIVNGSGAEGAAPAIDALVDAVAADAT